MEELEKFIKHIASKLDEHDRVINHNAKVMNDLMNDLKERIESLENSHDCLYDWVHETGRYDG